MKPVFIVFLLAYSLLGAIAPAASISGELKKWHKVTLSFTGPNTSESATPNPFTNYRLNVRFSHAASGKSYLVPGYYAADGNAANSSATSGNVWRVHFAPDETGTWSYSVSFRSGSNVATDASATAGSATSFDSETGSFGIANTDKSGRDFRGKGRLQYVGKHHLRFAQTGEYFMKAGVDAPENLLAYSDFDGEFKTDGRSDELVRDYAPHVQDWNNGDPTWGNGEGKGLIGAVNYLHDQGLNAFSFLTLSIEGDDDNVSPYAGYSDHTRLDCSKLDQWGIVFDHGTKQGMYLHFKTQETENELMLDSGNLGNQRKLYYRELIARFGHNLALNWNLGEEINGATLQQKQAWAQYFYDTDPYHHHIVIHNGATHYNMMGDASKLTGFSLQLNASDFTDNFAMTKDYIDRSVAAGKPWVVATDEPGDSRYALRPDDDPGSSHTDAREHALWGNIMAGGAGVEFYFGYALHDSDLTLNDFRSRSDFWPFCDHAIRFFENNDVPFQDMTNQNTLVSGNGPNANRCLAKAGDSYLIQLPSGGAPTLNLSGASGTYRVRWMDPRNGGALITGATISGGGTRSIGSPPNSTTLDWVALVQNTGGSTPTNEAPVVSAGADRSAMLSGGNATVSLSGSASDDGLPAGSSLTRTWSRVSGPGTVNFANAGSASTTATFTVAGSYSLRLTASDGSLSSSDDLMVTITSSSGGTNQAPVANAGTDRSAVLSGSSVSLGMTGSATDDGLPAGSTLSHAWSRVSGPAAVSFSSAASASTNATFTATGSYLLRLTVSDGSLSDTDEVAVTITAQGGGGTPVTLSATQDAYTENGANANNSLLRLESTSRERVSYLQFDASSLSGPASSAVLRLTQAQDLTTDSKIIRVYQAANNWSESTITADNAPAKGAQVATFTGNITSGMSLSFDVTSAITGPGIYSFILEFAPDERDVAFGSSENATASLRPTLTVTGSGGSTPSNAAPVVNAGADQSTSYRGQAVSVSLSGSASDDGLPQGSALALTWTRVSGPGTATIANPNAANTGVTFNEAGNYVFRLTASDGQLTSSDDTAVLVVSDIIDNEIPTVSAGTDKSANLSGSTVQVALDGSASDDGQPAGSALQVTWTRVSGPGTVNFANGSSAATAASFDEAGSYILRLTASDGELSDSDDMSVTISGVSGSPIPASFPATHDAYTENGNNINNGILRVENSSRKRISYLQFDLRSAPGPVNSAVLRLTEGDDISSGSMTLRLHAAASNSWTESGITGSNAPAKAGELASFTGDITNGKVVNFDVSSHVRAPGIYSFILEADAIARDVSFASSENSTNSARPVLNIVSSASAASAALSPPPNEAAADEGGISGMSLRLQLLGDASMEISGNGVAGRSYRIERSTDLAGWTIIAMAVAEEDGTVHFADPAPPRGQAFYRIAE
ncbi:DUF7594 domain-containing protein [Luteolibacter luteus]|uniref:DNRLRE domain-containing protein n=1 Tax=Luteolibacter luteus TaxID=2728835 RepID=A0A858RQP6_9BACT|nr:DNRLRE domain-containing protein [Luteolibacter luteus]QJE98854.1 DNRLRE domain-containing protein [Luteolibacter luteus]